MHVFSVTGAAEFNPKHHVEKILGTVADGDVTVACWEPGQISPNHCHPHATEIYFCFEGGGTMRTPEETIAVVPGAFVVHPPGEVHEYENGPQRPLFFRVRYGSDMLPRHVTWRGQPGWTQSAEDASLSVTRWHLQSRCAFAAQYLDLVRVGYQTSIVYGRRVRRGTANRREDVVVRFSATIKSKI
jgi:quercetin dioxygenase-like cupin family protein